MAKVVSFTKSLNQTPKHALDGFVDDGHLLEFPQPTDVHAQICGQELTEPTFSQSVFASDWTNQELADLYRAYSMIQSAQPNLECDRGVSDEGDPWFLIGDDKGDVLVHICRIKNIYILDSIALSKALKGKNFNALIEDFLTGVVGEHAQDADDTLSLSDPTNVIRLKRGGTVCLHPSMMLAALVWTLLMSADELTLPPSNGSNHKDLDQGQDTDRDTAVSSNDAWPNLTDPAAVKTDLVKLETAVANGFSSDLSTTGVIAQREEKQLHISAISHALTTVAIAAGFYTSVEATDSFWKSYTETPADTSASFDEIETSDLATPVDHLSDALALLSSIVDLVFFETNEEYAAENRHATDESTPTLTSTALETIETVAASLGQQMLTASSELSNVLAEASQTKAADTSGKEFLETENTAQADMTSNLYGTAQVDMATSLYGKDTASKPQEQTSDASMSTSIQGITQAYAAQGVDVSSYDTLSLKSGLGNFNGELQKYSEAFNRGASLSEEDMSNSETEDMFRESSSLSAFNDAARKFIDSKLGSFDLEMLVFGNEVIFVDKAVFSGSSTTVSWQLEDGGMVSMIGLSSDMAEFLVA